MTAYEILKYYFCETNFEWDKMRGDISYAYQKIIDIIKDMSSYEDQLSESMKIKIIRSFIDAFPNEFLEYLNSDIYKKLTRRQIMIINLYIK